MDTKKITIIIGAGPAGLTAGLELIRQSDIKPIIFEELNQVGGISRTINHNGNRMDIGGHRFFSKSDWVMNWWQEILPIDKESQQKKCLLIRQRLSRIYYLRKFFDYPIKLNYTTIFNLGLVRIFKIGVSYILANINPRLPEKNLEDFFINRFGKTLYLTFFKDYTEKVWGIACDKISPEWGAQRIKGLSITKAVIHALKKLFTPQDLENQKNTQTSLIERFLYPKYGPGQLWEVVADEIVNKNGEVHLEHQIVKILWEGNKATGIRVKDLKTLQEQDIYADYIISTMPVKNLIAAMENNHIPNNVKRVAQDLAYRDFITVGLLVKAFKNNVQSRAQSENNMPPDNWIYIQESDVKIGRLQIFNNWSPYLVKDENTIWLGLEYFCQEGDALWQLSDAEMIDLAIQELIKIDMLEANEVVMDKVVIRVPKAYPAYFGSYSEFNQVREFTDKIENLFLIGRNGMHRYNNQDHSMLTAKFAVENIINNVSDKNRIWNVNIDDQYHEEK